MDRLRRAGCVFAEEEAALLLANVAPGELDDAVARRVVGEPIEHILGFAEFAGLRILLGPGVFVPRRRTELLVALAVERLPHGGALLDLCCGSGAIAAAVASQRPDAAVTAADISPEAVAWAERNLAPFGGLTARVRDEYVTDDADIVLRPEETMGVPTPWHRGRVVLLGDAVHTITPHLGQGAAQAIEDGVVLAETLAAHRDHESAFAEYMARRYERCRLVVDTSLAIGEWEMGRLPGFDNVGATNHVLEVMARPL